MSTLLDRYALSHLNGYSLVSTKGFTAPTDGSTPKPKTYNDKTFARVSGAVRYLVELGEDAVEVEEAFEKIYKEYVVEMFRKKPKPSFGK